MKTQRYSFDGLCHEFFPLPCSTVTVFVLQRLKERRKPEPHHLRPSVRLHSTFLNPSPITAGEVTQNYLCLSSLSLFPGKQKLGGGGVDAFRVTGGAKPPERTEMFLLTLTTYLLFSPCHTTKGRGTQKAPPVGRSQSVTDHLRVYYNLVTQTRSEAVRP